MAWILLAVVVPLLVVVWLRSNAHRERAEQLADRLAMEQHHTEQANKRAQTQALAAVGERLQRRAREQQLAATRAALSVLRERA